MSASHKNALRIKRVTLTENGFAYETFLLRGRLNGQRVRKQFKSREEAEGEKARLGVEAANREGEIQAINTRLTREQVAEAESVFAQLGGKPLTGAVGWYLANYRPPAAETALTVAQTAFLADREPHVSPPAMKDYRRTLRDFVAHLPERSVPSITTAEIAAFLAARKVGKKRSNNIRADLHAFFNFCLAASRKWRTDNPVADIPAFRIARGIPEIITPQKAAELMAYVETFAGSKRSPLKPGALVPYFAICLFAGVRPSVRDGEIKKLSEAPDVAKLIDTALGVIRVRPEISKIREMRLVKIRPNLAAWFARYPLKDFPIVVHQDWIAAIRKKFALGSDVLRHSFVSYHIGAFRSVGDAALEAGNSEAMVRKHYLQMASEADAAAFWQIVPTVPAQAEAVKVAA